MAPGRHVPPEPAQPSAVPWSKWRHGHETEFDLGVEEEVMLLDPSRAWALSPAIDDVLAAWPEATRDHVSSETHSSAVELRTGVHPTAGDAVAELAELRAQLGEVLGGLGLAAGASGTHPSAVWHEMAVSSPGRHQQVYGSMRELARREPTFALHVHVGLPSGEAGIAAFNRLRAHLPVLLALSANSPFWQGRDTGLASARTPLFQAFPRVGIPRAFGSYGEYVRAVDLLLECGAIPEPTYLWWDVRPQPKLGTVELRIMDAQSTLGATAALVAFVQSLVRLELVDGYADAALVHAPEVLDENRFLAARDGVDAELVDPVRGRAVSVREMAGELMSACAPHAVALGCASQLALLEDLLDDPSPARQRDLAARDGLVGLVADLAIDFAGRVDRIERGVV
ncbi:MAG: glutamate---cysteine ligase / carboxylate-amine ligase [Solirubrobacteraceae bacterium]|jgi:carboxylate-amine ligase|nr:glutamate---cysteine ligase / carboxylate-amine ligase [Solirubrobacteraceae bacterium]